MTKKLFSNLLILSLIVQTSINFFAFPNQAKAAGTIYYVDSSITDTNPASATPDFTTYNPDTFATDTGSASVYKTIADVNLKSFVAGDSILFRRGQTWRETLTVPSTGTSGNPITFGAYGTGDKPIINGADIISGWTADDLGSETGGIWTSGLETENSNFTTEWTGKTVDVGNGVTVGTSPVHSGSKAMAISLGGTNPSAYGYKTITAANDVYVRFYLNLGSELRSSNWANSYVFLFRNGNYWNGPVAAKLNLQRGAGAGDYRLAYTVTYSGGTATIYGGASNEISYNTWYDVELHYKTDASVGGGEISINSVQKGSTLNLNTSANGVINNFIVGPNSQSAYTLASSLSFDDIKYDSSPIGAYPYYPNVWNATVTTEPNVVWFNGVAGTNKSSKSALASAGDWYWAGNVLSVYSATTPTNVEASQRNTNVYVQSRDYITIDNLELIYANDSDIYLKDAKYGIVQNSTIHDVHNHGIFMFLNSSGGHTIQNNTIYNTGINRHVGGEGSAIQTMNTVTIPITLQYNYIYNVFGDNHDHGYYDQTVGADIIRYNHFKAIAGDGVKLDTNLVNAQVYNNLFETCASNGVAVLSGSSATVYNNTIYNSGVWPTGASPYGGIWYLGAGSGSVIVKNNIIHGAGNGLLVQGTNTGFSSDNNLIYGGVNIGEWGGTSYNTLTTWKTISGQDTNSLSVDPKLVSASDFTLQSTSPVIDVGTSLGDTYKLGLNSNSVWPSAVNTLDQTLNGSGWEMGAYVYTQSTAPTVSISAPSAGVVSHSVTVTATAGATSPATVSSVQFKLDGVNLGSADTTSPYSITWDSTTATNGAHTLTAVATDNYSNTTTSSGVSVTVDNLAPVITITGGDATLYTGQTYSDLGATALDARQGDLTSSIVAVNPINTSVAGTYTVTYDVSDDQGNAATQVIRTVTVQTAPRGGGGSPAMWTLPIIPTTGFKMNINGGVATTSNRNVILEFNAGADIKKMSISMTGDFTDASQENYSATRQWDLCSKLGGAIKNPTCPDGKYTVYAQFYTVYGRSSVNAIASSIITLKSGSTTSAAPQYNFKRNLSLRMTGQDVKALQQYLNANGFIISKTGAGSPGKETTLFGTLTYKALVKFQKSLGWSGTGFFGPLTRSYINNH